MQSPTTIRHESAGRSTALRPDRSCGNAARWLLWPLSACRAGRWRGPAAVLRGAGFGLFAWASGLPARQVCRRGARVRRVSGVRFSCFSSPLASPVVSALLLVIALSPGLSQARALLLDEVVAVVDLRTAGPKRSILRSEVELSALIDRAMEQGASSLSAPLDVDTLDAALTAYVDRLVVVSEAQRLEVFQLDDDEADAAMAAFVDAIGRVSFETWLARSGQSLETVREVVVQDARVTRYLEGRFRLAARPRVAQVQAQWEAEHRQGSAEPFEAARIRIETQLEHQRFDELVAQFVADVRRRVRVRVLRDFGAYGVGTAVHGTVRAPQREDGR